VFDIGAQEMVIIGLLFLVIFEPGRLPRWPGTFGRVVGEARRQVDGFKFELTSTENGGGIEPQRSDRAGADQS
jgi:Sec-independent protein translocase protein TatA